MQYVQVPPAGAAHEAAPGRPTLLFPLAAWVLVVALTFVAYCAVVAHEAQHRPAVRYHDAGAHRSTLFTSPPNGRSILPAINAAVDDHEGGGDG